MTGPVFLLFLASAVELSVGPMLEDGYRPGARAGLAWTLTETTRSGTAGRSATHALVAGPDFATYVIPGVRWASLPGGTVAYHRTTPTGFRLGMDIGAAAAFHRYTVPTYSIDEEGNLETIPMAGRIRFAPSTRLTIGTAPTSDRSWGVLFRPSVFLEFPRNGMLAPVLTAEVAGTWTL